MALVPLNLFVTHDGKSKRQHVTCRYKCGDACSKPVPNTSDNEYFGDIVKAVSRRSMLQAGGVAVLAVGAGSALAACAGAEQPAATPTSSAPPAEPPPGMNFAAVAPNSEDVVVIPDGYEQAVVISWGDPILPNAPKFDVAKQTGAAQREQFGFNNDFAGLLPIDGAAEPLPARHQLRVRRPGVHVPRLRRRQAHPRAVRRRDRRGRHGRRGGRAHAAGPQTRHGPLQPPHHRRHPDDLDRTRRRLRLRQDPRRSDRPHRRGHLRQLRRRRDPVGHRAVRRGELPELLRRRRGLTAAHPRGRGPPRPLRRRAGAVRNPLGDLRPALRRLQDAQRAEPVRLHRRAQPVGPQLHAGQAHRDGTAQARGRQHLHHRRRHRGRLHRRRRTLRLHVQVRLEQEDAAGQGSGGHGAQHDAARRGHALRRQAVQRHPRQRDRRLGQAAVGGLVQRHRHLDPAAALRPRRSGRVTGRRHHRRRRPPCSPGWPPTRPAPPRWTGPKTSRPTRRPARSTSR